MTRLQQRKIREQGLEIKNLSQELRESQQARISVANELTKITKKVVR